MDGLADNFSVFFQLGNINRKKLFKLFEEDKRLMTQSIEKLKELHLALIIKNETDLVKLKKKILALRQIAGENAKAADAASFTGSEGFNKQGY